MSNYVKQSALKVLSNTEQKDFSKDGYIRTDYGVCVTKDGEKVDFDDTFLDGGLERGEVNFISGITNSGKTPFGITLLSRIAMNGYKGLFVTLEQSDEKMMFKILGQVTETHHNKLERMKFEKDKGTFDKWKKDMMLKFGAYIEDRIDIIYGSFNTKELSDILNKEVDLQEYDVIVVDNFQNCTYKDYTDFENMSRKVSTNIIGKKTSLVWLTQIDEKTGRTKNSRALEEDSSIGIKIYREKPEEKYKSENKNKNENSDQNKSVMPKVKDASVSYVDIVKNRINGKKPTELEFPFNTETGLLGTYQKDDEKEKIKAFKKKIQDERLRKETEGKSLNELEPEVPGYNDEKTNKEYEEKKMKENINDVNNLF